MPDCSNMCREAIIVFAGHSFINTFTLADAGVHVAALTGSKRKSLFLRSDEKAGLEEIRSYKKQLDKASEAGKAYHDDFMDTLRWIIPNLSSLVKRAVENKALNYHEWVDLLEWWFDVANKELQRVVE